jgi:hypothetical protein
MLAVGFFGEGRASTPTPVLVTKRWSTHPSGQAHGQRNGVRPASAKRQITATDQVDLHRCWLLPRLHWQTQRFLKDLLKIPKNTCRNLTVSATTTDPGQGFKPDRDTGRDSSSQHTNEKPP